MKYRRIQHEDYLNMLGIPEDDKKSNGGRISDHAKYGTWMRRNDKIAFELCYAENKSRYETKNQKDHETIKQH